MPYRSSYISGRMEGNRSLTNCFDHRSEDPNPQRIQDIPKSAKGKQTSRPTIIKERISKNDSIITILINSLMKKKFYTPLL